MSKAAALVPSLCLALCATSAATADDVRLFAAGSLRAAMTEMADAFKRSSGHEVNASFGSSGLFRERIAAGETPHVFASASIAHARAVTDSGKGGPVVVFARNRLCALSRAALKLAPASLIDTIWREDVRLATLTPLADPAGDLAFAMFARADQLRAGIRGELAEKVVHPTGGASEDQPPAGRNVYAWFFEQGKVDVFLTYCSSAAAARAELDDIVATELPPQLTVSADFALTVMTDAPTSAHQFAIFVLSPEGQAILTRHGLTAPTAPFAPPK